jgi:hypothetical protein
MKFQYKALTAALVLSAASLSAQAAMNTAGSGNSSLILTMLDNNANISATFDLGYNYSSFADLVTAANSGTFTWNVTSGDYANAWNTYWATASATDTKWAVYAADGSGNGVGAVGMITTFKSGSNLSLTTQLVASITNFDEYIAANNNITASAVGATSNHGDVANGASTATGGAAFAENAKAYGATGRVNASGYVATTGLDQSMTLVQLLSGANNTARITTSTLGNSEGNYSFALSSAGVLTFNVPVAAIPEADSYAMLLAGLGVVAAVVRRRKD